VCKPQLILQLACKVRIFAFIDREPLHGTVNLLSVAHSLHNLENMSIITTPSDM
jgi:hypothetical protein